MGKIRFKVYDKEHRDVTDRQFWYIRPDGTLCYEVNDIDEPVTEAEGYTYEVEVGCDE